MQTANPAMPFNILLVDDHEPLRRQVCLSLEQRSEFRIIQAVDGLEAVRKAEELRPDLILMDVGLPKINGIEAAKEIFAFAPDAKLLFVSLQSHSAIVQEAFRLGARGYVHKAFGLSDLLPAIDTVLQGSRFVGSGLDFDEVEDGRRHHHDAQFYARDSVFFKRTTRFIAAGLRAADGSIVIATNSHREGLFNRLKADGFDMEGAIQQGTCISLDAADTLSNITVNGVPDPVRFSAGIEALIERVTEATHTEHPRVAIFGECAGLLFSEGYPDAAVSLERVGADMIKKHNVDILCAYPLPHGQQIDRALKSICAEHTTVYWR